VRDGRAPDSLLLLEHPHVFTMGKAASADDLLWDEAERVRRDVEVIWSDRGGEATYHGPGQLVGYPILDLTHFGITIPRYLEMLEQQQRVVLAALTHPGHHGGLEVPGLPVAGATQPAGSYGMQPEPARPHGMTT